MSQSSVTIANSWAIDPITDIGWFNAHSLTVKTTFPFLSILNVSLFIPIIIVKRRNMRKIRVFMRYCTIKHMI